MDLAKVIDIEGSFEKGKKLQKGDFIVIQSLSTKETEEYGKVAEIQTTEGLRYSFAKAIVGMANSDKVKGHVKACTDKDASDGLNAWIVEKIATGTGRPMLALELINPNNE